MTRQRAEGLIGRSLPRPDGPDKVHGVAAYPQDLPVPPDCLHAATVRAPMACATLSAIDVTPALALSGVVRVLTAADVRGTNRFGLAEPDQPVLVESRVNGASDVIALVLATTEAAAREGARRVRLALTPMPGLFDPEAALQDGAPVVRPDRASASRHPNLLAERMVRRGNAARAMNGAAIVVEGVYRTSFVEHAFVAPEAGLATRDADGRLTLHVATQWPNADLRQAAVAIGVPRDHLSIVQSTIGGAFGGREDVSLQILLLLAAHEMRTPVRMVWDRRESVRGHGKRHPFRVRHRLAADARGRFVAAEVDVLIDVGCYASTSQQLLDNALAHLLGPYAIANVAVTGRAVFTNNPFTCAFRGFGANQVAFSMEQQVNKVADALGLDAAMLRRRNFVGTQGVLGLGSRVTSAVGLPRTLQVAQKAAVAKPLPVARGAVVLGRGIASAVKNIGFGFTFDDQATAEVTVARGGATVRIGAAEVGQGAETVLLQIAATALGLPASRVRIEWRDTREAPDAGSSSASRQTLASGNAVQHACAAARAAVQRAGGLARLPAGGLTLRRTWRFPTTRSFDTRPARHLATFGWATCVADVSVDLETGQVELLRVVNAIDAGRVINPRLFRGQVEGGVVMGQGYALQERMHLDQGMPLTLGFESCGVPTAMDAVPEIESLVVEASEALGPYGARGIGEIAMIPVVPAITAAIHAAAGVWIDELPASPARVRAAIDALHGTTSAAGATDRRTRRRLAR